MSEVDSGNTEGNNAGEMGTALRLASRIITDLNELRPSAWVLWQVIDNHISNDGYNDKKDSGMPNINKGYWGITVADHDNDKIILAQKYYAYGQFTRFHSSGLYSYCKGFYADLKANSITTFIVDDVEWDEVFSSDNVENIEDVEDIENVENIGNVEIDVETEAPDEEQKTESITSRLIDEI